MKYIILWSQQFLLSLIVKPQARNLTKHFQVSQTGLTAVSPTSSASTLRNSSSVGTIPDHPSLSDLGSIADLSGKFQSLTARKLMAGESLTSIDTLVEVNNAALNIHRRQSTDFGLI